MAVILLPVFLFHAAFYDIAKGIAQWDENGKPQGAAGDPKNIPDIGCGVESGCEIYDPGNDA